MFAELTKSHTVWSFIGCLSLAIFSSNGATAAQTEISGHYLEARSCQVYTGPCFANAETGLAGKEAVMAWKINEGQHAGVDLSGLAVVMAVHGSDTMGFGGLNDPQELKSIILVDDQANQQQRDALISFVRQYGGKAGQAVVRVTSHPISMTLNELDLKGKLAVGDAIRLETRKAGRGDCICSNEAAYYPPLAQVQHFAPGVTVVGEFKSRGLGVRWSSPGDRNAYMATFSY